MNENPAFLSEQLITYIGNKRSLLGFIEEAVEYVKKDLNKDKLECLDLFSGSGIVSRFLKKHSSLLCVNDLELYSNIINHCYLANKDEINLEKLKDLHEKLISKTKEDISKGNKGFISELYAPKDLDSIQSGERCFYTPRNAKYIDCMRQNIQSLVPSEYQQFFIAPLLSEASVHANTAGIFKGFYKNSKTGIGQFGGNGKNALSRICSDINLPFPVFSEHKCGIKIFQKEANALAASPELYCDLKEKKFDLVYMDPPYNQHPYGSNYFMLNLIAEYKKPDSEKISRISGIPSDWNRSFYNKKRIASQTFEDLIETIRSKYIVISFNNEGFISKEEMEEILNRHGRVKTLESAYNTFRGSRNLKNRSIHVSEYLFILKKN